MKEFDFVKLTLWLSAVLIAGLAGGYVYVGSDMTQVEEDIKEIQTACTKVGERTKDLKILETEKRNDKTPDTVDEKGLYTFFANQAHAASINPNLDYTLRPRDPTNNVRGGWVDQEFIVDFKKDKQQTREQIMVFIYMVETQSRHIKLQKARITLDEEHAMNELDHGGVWKADSLTFVRRDPIKGAH